MIKIKLPDGSEKEFEKHINGLEIAKNISPSLAKAALFLKVDNEYKDLKTPIEKNSEIKILTEKDKEEILPLIRHTAAHVMAEAVQQLYPKVKMAIGPSIENGFYYDFDFGEGKNISIDDLAKIEKKMNEIIDKNEELIREEWTKEYAIEYFKKQQEDYKVELVKDLPEDKTVKISIYKQGDFIDLCKGPHLPSTGRLPKAFKLMKVAGAYWRGDSKNKMLQRIYGTAWLNKKDLDSYLNMLEEAEKRDHRKIGKEMDLFHFEPDFAPGSVFWHPNGLAIYHELIAYMRQKQKKAGYIEIDTPRLMDRALWEKSGHWEKYGEHNYSGSTEDGKIFCVKPMNCPGGILVFNQDIRSYKDLPLKVAEFGKVNRYEASGALHGLLRVREFTQDDAHIYCTPDQIEEEVIKVTKLIFEIYNAFGFDKVRIKLSTRPEKRIGSDKIWDISEEALRKALEKNKYEYTINAGEGAFYGPKLEFVLIDAIGRDWQCGTIQVDMNLPARFKMKYIGEDGKEHEPVMLHRALFGSIERFLGILIEHYTGHFPIWLSPLQVIVIPISDKHITYADKIYDQIFNEEINNATLGIRINKDYRAESMQRKVRDAQLQKIPYMIIIGDKEQETNTISIRLNNGDQILNINLDKFIKLIKTEIKERKDKTKEEKEKLLK